MVCIYCRAPTEVTNSRPQKQLNNIWRRRKCRECANIFTTKEMPELETSFMVKNNQMLSPFSRDRLFISIYESCKHRTYAYSDASALTQLIISQIVDGNADGVISREDVIQAVLKTLKRFDSTAATIYAAYYPARPRQSIS